MKNQRNKSKKGFKENKHKFDSRQSNKKAIDDYESKRTSEKGYENDLSWHVVNAQMLADTASLSFANALTDEATVNQVYNLGASMRPSNKKVFTPGIMAIDAMPWIGEGFSATPDSSLNGAGWTTNATNIATKANYAFVRKSNAGSAPYDAPDLMMYYLAMDSVYSLWSWAVRLYGILRTYSFKNRYMPKRLFEAMGIPASEYDDVLKNMTQLRYVINNAAIRMSSLAVPANMPLFKRHMWLFSNIFKDCDDPKAQLYLFNLPGVYKYDEVNNKLEYVALDWTVPGFIDTLQQTFATLLDPLIYSQSISIMSGDVLKAYEAGNIYGFSTIDEGYTVFPVYMEKALPQIHNLVMLGFRPADILQTTDGIIYQMLTQQGGLTGVTGSGLVPVESERLLNVPYQNPTPEDVLYATRFMPASTVELDANGGLLTHVQGTSELIINIRIFYDLDSTHLFNADSARPLTNYIHMFDSSADSTKVTMLSNWMRLVNILSEFDWAPQFHFDVLTSTSNYAPIASYELMDLANYTVVSNQFLKKINDGDLFGLYGVPYTLTQK